LLLGLVIAAVTSPRPAAQGDVAQWRAVAYIKASNAGEDDHLSAGDNVNGVELALSRDGNTMVVGARREASASHGINGNQADNSAADSGAAYIFARSGGTWVQQAYLKASNAQAGDGFGFAVAVSGDGNTVAVSANFEDGAAAGVNGDQGSNAAENSGAVYLFIRTGTAWSQQAYIKASNTESDDRFGYSLALSDEGNTLAVGASNEDSVATGMNGNQADNSAGQAGAAYVFTRAAGNWSQQAYIKPSIRKQVTCSASAWP